MQKYSAMSYLCRQHNETACKGDAGNKCNWRSDLAKCELGADIIEILFCPGSKVCHSSLQL